MSAAESTKSEKVESNRPLEILCQILQFVVRSDGVKALLPSTHVNVYWRRAALGDPSLWTTVYLKQTSPPLLDMILARSGNQLFTIHADHHDLDRHAKLWVLVHRFEEFHYHASLEDLAPFLAHLGPAPNLKVLRLRPLPSYMEMIDEQLTSYTIKTIFAGCLPSLRDLTLPKTLVWPSGLFRGLTSFDCGTATYAPVSPTHVLDALRGSPLIKSLRVVGCCLPIEGNAMPRVTLSSLNKCTLLGEGTGSLIQFITTPETVSVSLSNSYVMDWNILPPFSEHSVAPGLRSLGNLSAVSFSIDDHAVRLRAGNDRGGVLDVVVDNVEALSRDPATLVPFVRSSFECWSICPGLKTTKEFKLSIDRGKVWGTREAAQCALDLVRLISNLPGIEEATFRGVPPVELGSIFGFLARTPELQCPNLKRLNIVSSPHREPRLLLAVLGKLLVARKEAGVPFQFVTVKVKSEKLIPPTEHCAFLTSWEGLVGGGVRLEYERTEVEGGGEGGTDDPGDTVGWDGWPEQWPKTVEEMRGR